MTHRIDYTPPPTISEFIQDFRPGELFFDWVLGPVGSGKTTGIFFKLVYMACLQAPSPRDKIRRSRAVIVRNTMPQLRDTTLSSWNYWFKDGQAGSWRATNSSFTLRFDDVECEVLFRPLDTPDDVARVLSLEVTFAILDEFVQIDPSIVEALSARCGRYPAAVDGGATNWGMWGSSNPGNEDSWWFELLEEKLPSNWRYFKQPSGLSPRAENLDNLPGGAKYYASLCEGKSEHWIKQFIEVCWGYSLEGTPVLKSFNPEWHIAKRQLLFNPHLPLIGGFDPGMNSALILGQHDLSGRLLVLSSLVTEGYGAKRFIAEVMKPHLAHRFPGLHEFIISPDPAAFSRSQTDEKSVVDEFRAQHFTVKVPDMNNQLTKRIEAMEHFTMRLTPAGPALQIDPEHCKPLIRALQTGWRYKAKKDGETALEPEKNKHSHPADGFGYLCRYVAGTDPVYASGQSVRRPPAVRPSRYHVR